MKGTATHPQILLARAGVGDLLSILAVVFVALLQYVFLLKLWLGYPLKLVNDVIHENVVITGLCVSFIGVLSIVILSVQHWSKRSFASRKLEKPATDQSFRAIADALQTLTDRSDLCRAPMLLYTPRNATVLEVRHNKHYPDGAIVVGLDQRVRQLNDPESFNAQIGHEISHIESGNTNREIWARRMYYLHTAILAWLVLVFLLVIGFIDPVGISSNPRYFGFEPIFSTELYMALSSHLVVMIITWTICYVFTKYYIARREHLHDIRGSQLAQNDTLVSRVFEPLLLKTNFLKSMLDAFSLHPSAARRIHVLNNNDFLVLSVFFYPLLVAAMQPLSLLLLAGWKEELSISHTVWIFTVTILSGLVLYGIIAADLVRIGLSIVLRKWSWKAIPVYAGCAALATQVPRIVLELIYGVKNNEPLLHSISDIWQGFLYGGVNIALMIFAILCLLSYTHSVRLAANGENAGLISLIFGHCYSAVVVVGGFMIASLSSIEYVLDVLFIIVVTTVMFLLIFSGLNSCKVCQRKRWRSLLTISCCACGYDNMSSYSISIQHTSRIYE